MNGMIHMSYYSYSSTILQGVSSREAAGMRKFIPYTMLPVYMWMKKSVEKFEVRTGETSSYQSMYNRTSDI